MTIFPKDTEHQRGEGGEGRGGIEEKGGKEGKGGEEEKGGKKEERQVTA